MVLLLARGVGLLVKSLAGFSCVQATRCISLSGAVSTLPNTTSRWFSKSPPPDNLPNIPIRDDFPKRPLTSFFRFIVQHRPSLLKKNPELKTLEISKLLAREWRELPESDKKPYIEAANADYLNYKDEMRKFKQNLSPLELDQLKRHRKQKKTKRIFSKKKRELSVLGKPKGNRNAFNIFMSEHFQDNKGGNLSAKMTSLHDKWNTLPSSQKQMYIQLAEDDKIRYENEMKSWEEQMLEIGREDLIRTKVKKRLGIQKAADMHSASSRRKSPKKAKQSEKAKGSLKDSSKWIPEE